MSEQASSKENQLEMECPHQMRAADCTICSQAEAQSSPRAGNEALRSRQADALVERFDKLGIVSAAVISKTWLKNIFMDEFALAAATADWCDVCDAPQMVLPNGDHVCGESATAERTPPTVPEELFVLEDATVSAANVLTNCCQILDVVKPEWAESWSDWDQSVRDAASEWLEKFYIWQKTPRSEVADRQPAATAERTPADSQLDPIEKVLAKFKHWKAISRNDIADEIYYAVVDELKKALAVAKGTK